MIDVQDTREEIGLANEIRRRSEGGRVGMGKMLESLAFDLERQKWSE